LPKLDDYLAFYLFSYILPRDPEGRFRSNKLVRNSSLASPLPILFPRTSNVREPKAVSENAGWKCHSKPFGTVVSMVTLFRQPEGLSKPPDCQNKY